jgi:hypothetical protein
MIAESLWEIYHRGCARLAHNKRDKLITRVCQAHVHVHRCPSVRRPSARTRIPEKMPVCRIFGTQAQLICPSRPSHGQLFQSKGFITVSQALHASSSLNTLFPIAVLPLAYRSIESLNSFPSYQKYVLKPSFFTYSSLFTSFACDGAECADKKFTIPND